MSSVFVALLHSCARGTHVPVVFREYAENPGYVGYFVFRGNGKQRLRGCFVFPRPGEITRRGGVFCKSAQNHGCEGSSSFRAECGLPSEAGFSARMRKTTGARVVRRRGTCTNSPPGQVSMQISAKPAPRGAAPGGMALEGAASEGVAPDQGHTAQDRAQARGEDDPPTWALPEYYLPMYPRHLPAASTRGIYPRHAPTASS